MASSILLKNGTALIHDPHTDRIQVVTSDILIEGDKISKIAKDISHPQAEVIDCSDKIISPGFIDTHHHVWQTQLKGRHANETLLQYMPSGNYPAQLFTAKDVFWGQLGGCMEMINCGTTTVVDWAHGGNSPEKVQNAIAATAASGIRSVYCYAAVPTISNWETWELDMNALAGDVLPHLEEVVKKAPYGDGRIEIGFAFDAFPYIPKQYLDGLMAKLNDLKIPIITMHYMWRDSAGSKLTPVEKMEQAGIMDDRWLMAHSNNSPKEDAEIYKKRGVHISSTPSTEMQMTMGFPVMAFRKDLGIHMNCSFGVDCHSNNAAFIPGEARIGLQGARAARGEVWLQQGKVPREVGHSVEESFILATIGGARAAKLADKTGSIAEGKFADLVLFDKNTPSMVCAGDHDPIAAIILNSSPADVDTVIVGGHVRKRDGKLLPVQTASPSPAGQSVLEWADVAKTLVRSRKPIKERIDKVNPKAGVKAAMQHLNLDAADIVDVE